MALLTLRQYWLMKKVSRIKFTSLILFWSVLVSCDSLTKTKLSKEDQNNDLKTFDYDLIKKRGKIIVLTDNNSTNYFVYHAEPMGFEFELLHQFAKEKGLDLEMKVAENMNNVIDRLNLCEVDLIAANLTITKERSQIVSFTEPLLYTKQVLIQRKPEKNLNEEHSTELIRNVTDLIGKNISVRKESSFYERLKNLSEEIGGKINIIQVSGDADTEELIEKVANGEIEYTVADENVAVICQNYYPNIDIKTAISLPQRIAWAVRKNSPLLLNELNLWIEKKINTNGYATIFNKYYKNSKSASARVSSEYFSPTGNRISVYDELIKHYSKKIDWDWKLLAALVCQESRFDPTAQSWMGAYGLMQITPATSIRYGIDSIAATPEQSLNAGTSYLKRLDDYWKDYIFDKDERIKFVLASYNVGLGHVIDARTLTQKYNRKPNLWDKHVAYFLLQKTNSKYYNDPTVKFGYCRGMQPCNYVKEILNRYEHYKNLIRENPAQKNATARTNTSS